MDFLRQHGIFEPDNQRLKIQIIGVGSTGSFLTFALSKLGYKDIKCIDFDTVETHNIPVQLYKISDLSLHKVVALKQIIEQFTGESIQIDSSCVDESYQFEVDNNSVIVLCVDNMETRKLIYKQLELSGQPCKLIDTRMGGEGYSIQVVDMGNQEDREKYQKSLEVVTKDLPCGFHAVIYCIMSLVSEVTNIIKKIEKEEVFPKILKRELGNYRILTDYNGTN